MLLLTTTTDKIQLITSAAATVDVHASWADNAASTITLGRTNTAITTAATTDIVASPGASTSRNIKTLHVRNKHATLSVDVTVIYDQNATDYELHKATLRPGEMLEYVEGIGFFTLGSARGSDAASMAGDVAIANTETVVVSKACTASELTVGMTFAFRAFATRAGTTSAQEIIRVRIGPTTLTGNIAGTLTPPASTLAVPISIEGLLTIRTAGAGGTAIGSLMREQHLAAVTITPAISPSTATVAVDTTVANLIELTFISANAANTYTFRNAAINRV